MYLEWFHERRQHRHDNDPLVVGLERIKHGERTFTPRRKDDRRRGRRRRGLADFGVPFPIKHNPIQFPSVSWEREWNRALRKADYFIGRYPQAYRLWRWEQRWR